MLSQATQKLLGTAKQLSNQEQLSSLRIGDTESVVLANVRMVASLSRNYGGKTLDADDFFQAGIQGLMEAVERFDADLSNGATFTTYASNWVKKYIAMELNNDLGVSMSDNLQQKERKEIRDGKRERATSVTSGDAIEGGWEKIFGVKEEKTPYIEELRYVLSSVKLDKREEAILRKKYGLDESVPLTNDEIAEHMGCTGERVRQILKITELKIKKEMCRL